MTQQMFATAFQLHTEGALLDAKCIYEDILEKEPLHFDARHLLGLLSHQSGAFMEAERIFLAGIALKPEFHQIYSSYAQTLFDLERFDEAITCYDRAIQIAPKEPDAYFERGVIFQKMGRSAQALADFDKGLARRTDYATAYNNRGAALVALNRRVEALESYAKAIVLEPENALAYSNQASALKESGRPNEAIGRYDLAILLDPHKPDYLYNKANALNWMKRTDEAIESLNKAIELNPDHADAIFSRGNAFQYSRLYEEAIEDYSAAISLRPEYAKVYSSLGEALRSMNRLEEALKSYERAVCINPQFSEAWFNKGNVFKTLGQKEHALHSYKAAITANPDYIEGYYNQGIMLREMGRTAEALESYDKAIIKDPAYAAAFLNKGLILMESCLFNEALKHYDKAINIKPDYAEAYNNRGLVYMNLGDLQKAFESYSRAIGVTRDSPEILLNLGVSFMEMERHAEALTVYERAIMLNPQYAHAYNNQALALKEKKQFDEALRACDIAIILNPKHPETYNNKGVILKELGRFHDALPAFKIALEITPDYLHAHSNLLFTLNYIDDIPTETRVNEARIYGATATRKRAHAYKQWPKTQHPGRLRIGLVSGDLRNHPVGYFLESFLSTIDASAFELVAYATHRQEDALTSRIKPGFKLWRSLHGLTDAAAAKLIHDDGMNILIDLSGHTAKNRLPVFAFKPAPVQASWLGYFATTGVEQIDYLIGDPYVTPMEERAHFSEKIKRLPETYLCFTPPNHDIPVAGLPALDNGYVTFGSFNNFSKINDAVMALWARVLRSTPNSRLFMKAAQLGDPEVVESARKQFQSYGVNPDRLSFEGQTDRTDYFTAYNKVDIALDPFPYPGGTTSVEGLWMGVPVIARKGHRFIAHNGETIAHNSGQSHWIAEDDDDYVHKAIEFSSDLPALALTRAGLRDQLLASPFCDARRFARHFEQAMLEMWSDFQSQP